MGMPQKGAEPPSYHHNPLLRNLNPPRPVWINLAAMYPLSETPQRFIPKGLDLQAKIPGRLLMWAVTTTGHWAGWVVFVSGHHGSRWVLANALEPRRDQPVRRDQQPNHRR